MNLIPIYEDNEQIISIDSSVLNFLEYTLNSYFKIHNITLENIVDVALKNFSLYGGYTKGKRVISTNRIPIISKNRFIELTYPYVCFEDAMVLITQALENTYDKSNTDWKRMLEILITIYYRIELKQFCLLHFLEEKQDRISGILTFEDKNDIIILPFELNEDDNYYTLH